MLSSKNQIFVMKPYHNYKWFLELFNTYHEDQGWCSYHDLMYGSYHDDQDDITDSFP